MFSYIGIGINLFLLLLLTAKKGKTLADKILAAWLFVIACHLSIYTISFEPITASNIHWVFGSAIPFPLLHGPFLYLYTAAMTNQLPLNRKLLTIHFLPAVGFLLYFLPAFLLTTQEKIDSLASGLTSYKTSLFAHIITVWISGLCYVTWSFYLLRKHKKNIASQFSYEEKINLNWLRYLIGSMAVVWAIIFFLKNDAYIFNAVVVFVILLGYFGIKQVGIFTENTILKLGKKDSNAPQSDSRDEVLDTFSKEVSIPVKEIISENSATEELLIETKVDTEADIAKKTKYRNSLLAEDTAVQIHTRLTKLMKDEKIFSESQLTLSILANKLNIHPNYLSQVINEREAKSFFDYINALRVKEFKRLLSIPENKQFTMMSLAYDCGFNSKTAFYRNFKNITGQSPTDYLKQQSIQIRPE
jgi:AraC-like DNA-binding protein